MIACRLAPLIALLFVQLDAPVEKYLYDLTGKVVSVTDGDTITVLDANKVQHKIRFEGIDAPEKTQPFGTKAREVLAGKVFGQEVEVRVLNLDRYQREVGRVFIGPRSINQEMVREGFAWRDPQYDKRGIYVITETDARNHKRGLWIDPNPVPPWEFSRQKRAGRR